MIELVLSLLKGKSLLVVSVLLSSLIGFFLF